MVEWRDICTTYAGQYVLRYRDAKVRCMVREKSMERLNEVRNVREGPVQTEDEQ